jgi:hypothetical protein
MNGADVSVTCVASVRKNGWCWGGSFFTFVSPITSINVDANNNLDVLIFCPGLPSYQQCAISGTALVSLVGAAILLAGCCLCALTCYCICGARRRRGGYTTIRG